ncbi:MAG: cell division protein ZapA [Bacteroidia bacterium]|nr:cell division protein ZapA [Bacteroidia bacterium]
MDKYSIKVNILGRPYPLLVKTEEEESVRNAARLINEKIKVYKERFSVKDDLDLVIMCCLELATDNIHQSARVRQTSKTAGEKIARIDELLNSAILTAEEDIPLKDEQLS